MSLTKTTCWIRQKSSRLLKYVFGGLQICEQGLKQNERVRLRRDLGHVGIGGYYGKWDPWLWEYPLSSLVAANESALAVTCRALSYRPAVMAV